MIHPSSVIHPNAQLGDNVNIGPFCVVGEHVVLGDNCHLHSHVSLTGHTTCGQGNIFYPHTAIGGAAQERQESGDPTRLTIGDRNIFRECATAHVGTQKDKGETHIGSDNLFMAYTHIAHDAVIGDNVVFSNSATVAGHVQVHDWAVLSGGVSVHQFGRIGAHAFIGGHSGVVQDVPPFVFVMGTPAKPITTNSEGMKRRGFSSDDIRTLRRAYKTVYRKGLRLEEALAALADDGKQCPAIQTFIDFFADSTRGVVR